jgi:phosphonate transport system permease protein
MSLIGSLAGSLIAVPFAMLASTNVCPNKVIVALVRVMFSLVRTLPTIVTALVATLVFGLGTLASTVAIAIFSIAYIGKLTYEEIETVDMGAFEAMEAMGATKTQAFMSAIVPQALPFFLSNCLFNFEGNVRYAAVLGYVGAGGIGIILNEKIGWRDYPSVGMILIALFAAVFIIETVSRYFRRKLV